MSQNESEWLEIDKNHDWASNMSVPEYGKKLRHMNEITLKNKARVPKLIVKHFELHLNKHLSLKIKNNKLNKLLYNKH